MPDDDDRDEGFLTRWSRRKQETGRAPAAAPDTPEGSRADDEPDEAELERNRLAAEAVDIDALGKGDDFSVFLKRGVPDLLRRKALRRLWRSDPVLANLDGLNDYDEDFRNPAHNVFTSVWRAGRGFLSTEEQQAQHDTGRMSRDRDLADPADGETGGEEATDVEEAVAETAAGDGAFVPPETGAETDGIEAEPGSDGNRDGEENAAEDRPAAIASSTGEEAGGSDEASRQSRRVSIRRRLEG